MEILQICCGLAQQAAKHHTATHSLLPGGIEERIRKVQELMGWRKDILWSKAKATYTSKAKQEINSLLPIGRQVFSHFHEGRAHHT